LTSKHVKLLQTTLKVMHRSAEFLNYDEVITTAVFRFVAKNIDNPKCKHYASNAFESLCEKNSNFVLINIDSFMIMY